MWVYIMHEMHINPFHPICKQLWIYCRRAFTIVDWEGLKKSEGLKKKVHSVAHDLWCIYIHVYAHLY